MKTNNMGVIEQSKFSFGNIKILPILLAMLMVVPVVALMTTKNWPYAMLVAPVIVAGLFLMSNKFLGIYLLIIQIPFGAFRKIDIGSTSINIAWVIAGVSVFALAVELATHEKSFSVLKGKIWWLLMPMFFVNALATVFSPYPDTAVSELIGWIAAYIFIALIIVRIGEKGYFNTVPMWLVASTSAGSLCAVLGVYFNIGAEYFTQDGRGVGGAPDPNNMCLMIDFIVPIVLYFFINARNTKTRLLFLALLLLNLIAIVSTNSRSGTLVAGLMIVIMMMANHGKITGKLIKLLIPIGLSVLMAVPFVLPKSLIERMMTLTAAHGDSSLSRRASYIKVAMDAYFNAPVIGTGPFTFQNIYEKSREARRYLRGGIDAKITLQRQAHNTYLEILVGSGTLGMIFFLGTIIVTFLNFSRARSKLFKNRYYLQADLMTAYQLSLISLLIFFTFFSDPTHKYFLLIIALGELAMKYSQQMQREGERTTKVINNQMRV